MAKKRAGKRISSFQKSKHKRIDFSFFEKVKRIYPYSLWSVLAITVFLILQDAVWEPFYYFALAAYAVIFFCTVFADIAALKDGNGLFVFFAVFPVFLPGGIVSNKYPGEGHLIQYIVLGSGALVLIVGWICMLKIFFYSSKMGD